MPADSPQTLRESCLESQGFLTPEEADPLRYHGMLEEPNEIARVLAGLVPRDSRVLDVGCGTGLIAWTLQEYRGAQVTGIEPSEPRARAAESRGIRVLVSPFAPDCLETLGKFDVIVFADVLEHMVDPAAALRLALSALTPEGLMVVSLPNVAHWSVRWNLLRGRFDYQPCGIMDATHLRWFTRESATVFFRRLGLRIVAYEATLLAEMAAYQRFIPLGVFPKRIREALLRRLLTWRPGMFAWQHCFQLQTTEACILRGARACHDSRK